MRIWMLEKLDNALYEIKRFNPSLEYWINLGILVGCIVMVTYAGNAAVSKGMEGDMFVSILIPFLKFSYVAAMMFIIYRASKDSQYY